jgi:ketosteroid isomerase-like protein
MKGRLALGMIFALIAAPAWADDAITIAKDIGTKWVTAYNNGDAAKVAALYAPNAVWVRPTEVDKGREEIEKAVANLMKQFPKLNVEVAGAGESGSAAWFHSNFAFQNGPSGHSGLTFINDGGTWHIVMHVTSITPKP